MPRNTPTSTGVAAVLAGLASAAMLAMSAYVAPSTTATVLGTAASLAAPREASAHYPAVDLASIAEKTTPSVVNISSTRIAKGREASPFLEDPFFRRFFQLPPGEGIPQERRSQSLGSGVIVSEDGIVLTNNHVVEHADEIRVTLSDGRELEAGLVGSDPRSDVAVLRIEDPPSGLRALAFGDSSALRLADTVLAIGNPFGVGQTVTMGIVSATGRANVGIADYEDFIQTDAAINPGNSGGALLNTRGELVGINTAIVSRSGGYQGIGFAIPSNMARSIMESLLEDGKVERGWLGVAIQPLDRDLAEALGIDQGRGVLVADVTAKSPAAKAGIERGDVILSIDGREVRSTGELRNLVAARPAGSEVDVKLLREGKPREVEVTLGELPADEEAEETDARGDDGLFAGVVVGDLDAAARRQHGIDRRLQRGAVILELEPRSPAGRAGLAPGDVILEVERSGIADAEAFRAAAAKVKGDKALLLVARGEGTLFLIVRK